MNGKIRLAPFATPKKSHSEINAASDPIRKGKSIRTVVHY